MGADDQVQDYRLDVLRAAGHGDAADLLSKLPVQAPAVEVEQAEPEERGPGLRMTPYEAAEAGRKAEGEMLLRGLREAGIVAPAEAA